MELSRGRHYSMHDWMPNMYALSDDTIIVDRPLLAIAHNSVEAYIAAQKHASGGKGYTFANRGGRLVVVPNKFVSA